MREDIAGPQGASSRPMWETLEGMVREKAQEFIQQIMEEEVTELLGREKSERRSTVDSAEGYRNGYGKPRRLAMSSGTIMLRRPRVRGVEERFESRVLPLFARRTKELGALLPELYLHGLAEGDFELAMRGLLGEGAPLSKSSIRRLRAGWTAEFEEWSKRSLADREVVYVWADGIYVKAGLERDKAALLVVLGAMRDGTKEVLALRSGYRESVESWSEVLRDLKARGIEAPRLLVADGNAAIWGAVRQVWPEAGEQRCWNHKMRNVLDRLPQREQSEAKDLLRAVVYAPSRSEAVKAREVFARRYRPWYPKAVDVLEDDWEPQPTTSLLQWSTATKNQHQPSAPWARASLGLEPGRPSSGRWPIPRRSASAGSAVPSPGSLAPALQELLQLVPVAPFFEELARELHPHRHLAELRSGSDQLSLRRITAPPLQALLATLQEHSDGVPLTVEGGGSGESPC